MVDNLMDESKSYDVHAVFFFKNFKSSISIFISYEAHERLKSSLDRFDPSEKNLNTSSNFIAETLDGKYIGISLNSIQAVRFLLELKGSLSKKNKSKRSKILLHGREAFIEVPETADSDNLYDFFHQLDIGESFHTDGPFLYLYDEDDEEFYINTTELIYIEAPAHVVKKGDPDDDGSLDL